MKVTVTLFKPNGKYYTAEEWEVPGTVPREDGTGERETIGPFDMAHSPDFRRISGGAVLVDSQEPWGYPHLFPAETAPTTDSAKDALSRYGVLMTPEERAVIDAAQALVNDARPGTYGNLIRSVYALNAARWQDVDDVTLTRMVEAYGQGWVAEDRETDGMGRSGDRRRAGLTEALKVIGLTVSPEWRKS